MSQKQELEPILLNKQDHTIQDAYLQKISSQFITVKDGEKKYYIRHLTECVKLLIQNMKEADPLFRDIFQRDIPAGSYWDGLKIGKPVEFDKNFVLNMPDSMRNRCQILPATPSFVMLNVKPGQEMLKSSKESEILRKLEPYLDPNGNIIADKIRWWMESVVSKAINILPQTNYICKPRKSGPAMTVEVTVRTDNAKFNIDIVPAFEFSKQEWLPFIRPYPANIDSKPWHLVPKPLKDNENVYNNHEYPLHLLWRLSFHEQESALINDSHHLKAVIKIMKKLRDNKVDQHLLTSYAIKTVFLWEMTCRPNDFWRQSLINTFLHMLRVLTENLSTGQIPFYWDEKYNLLGYRTTDQRTQLYNTFRRVYGTISAGLQSGSDPLVIAKELLTGEELRKFYEDVAH